MVPRILIIAGVLISFTSALLAPFITPCKASDEECIVQNTIKSIPFFADGIPDLAVKPLDPLFFKNVDSSSPNLKFILSDITFKGLKDCKPIKVQRIPEKSNVFLKISCPLTVDGQYEMEGQLLVVKIAGKGKVNAYLPNLEVSVTLDMIDKEKDGQKYWRIKKFTHSFDVTGDSKLEFEGLLQDNQVLSQAANDLIKNSSNEVIKEIAAKLVENVITYIVGEFNHFFGKVPVSELALD
ncbi:circadian clock-controlled protein daywake-like [Helicoverpa zea]|uniref:circadian clock-controlled protein daywake-like n=1 Tax=Helicoverpa zea TaxID=7113 RepID=UPI001F5AE574|nr:circadian clock-controlled protein daywake-like [Helicoverpa zea]